MDSTSQFFIDSLKKSFPSECFKGNEIHLTSQKISIPKEEYKGQEIKVFDPEKAEKVKTNFEIDRQIKLKTPPDSLVMIDAGWQKFSKDKIAGQIKPIAAYMNYIDSLTLAGKLEKTIEKKKGFSQKFTASLEIKAGVSAGIFGCEASLEVTTGFSYEQEIKTEVTETWKETLEAGSYCVYQNCILYAVKLVIPLTITIDKPLFMEEWKVWIYTHEYGKPSNTFYYFVPCFRNDPFTIKYTDELYRPIMYQELIDYVMGDGWNRW